ncbi:MexH family multidrug efflux RND transporter periplasmic adaptor subunit [Parapedobacter pyrenivorans]|uniref:MexH family multidrug efflux RND transporter periplasmic adaptor subunit n=1 Tax=Parapedobacter pyrenivorans TaxID=1305674 RepID=A0A917MB73_9SPHI|nr:efflux RND transporter periplasmic adaptor subunit [Parapedobacter pyrenivorans]GGG89156.1 MexH family multidrug efflux RND transporter periplasmic adaptor subunit [Parapedobacter pyrenivorans]
MKRIIVTIVVVAGLLALIGWVLTNNKKENEAKTAVVAETGGATVVKAATVSRQPIVLDFSANGNFAANQDLKLLSEVSGRITKLLVREGARVNRGQVLALVDPELTNLDKQVAEENLQKLKTDYARYKSSYETGGVTKSQLDDIELQLRNAEIKLQQESRRVADANIKAPINGTINSRSVEIGTYLSPGTELFEIVDLSQLKLKVTANETQVVNLNVGDEVTITSTVFPAKEFTGKVSFIAAKADNTLNYPVEIIINNSATSELRAGMYGTAHFKFPQQEPTILIPRGAFVGGVNSNQVYVLGADSAAAIRKVIAGRIFGEQVEIVKGLEEGETVITSGQINLVDGAKVDAQVDSTNSQR